VDSKIAMGCGKPNEAVNKEYFANLILSFGA
jgi:hypothetical protein